MGMLIVGKLDWAILPLLLLGPFPCFEGGLCMFVDDTLWGVGCFTLESITATSMALLGLGPL